MLPKDKPDPAAQKDQAKLPGKIKFRAASGDNDPRALEGTIDRTKRDAAVADAQMRAKER